MPASSPPKPSNIFLFLCLSIFFILMVYPWLIGLISLFLLIGYHSLPFVRDTLRPFLIQKLSSIKMGVPSIGDEATVAFDPLLHTSPAQNRCSVCSVENCSRDLHGSPPKIKDVRHSSSHRVDQDFKVDPALDASIARFCTAVFNCYISPTWAPYETRRQLRLALAKLLMRFAERIKDTFVLKPGSPHVFCKEKVFPLFFFHLEELKRGGKKLSKMDERRANWKVRRLSQAVLTKCLPSEDQKCKLWMELCVAVLGDGVLWNLILMGRTWLPELLESRTNSFLESLDEVEPEVPVPVKLNASHSTGTIPNPLQEFDDKIFEDALDVVDCESEPIPQVQIQLSEGQDQKSPDEKSVGHQVPFLLETFLDPCHDIEQPASIVSRWRPTLNDILSERDLLYCLIQYLKDRNGLEYLQAVMDESPDGSTHCRKILELEFLPGFCRSRIFLENLGLSRVEVGLEAGTESSLSDNGSKKSTNQNHARSLSYGGSSSGAPIWKFGQNVVDGFAIPSSSSTASIPSLAFPGTGTMEPDSIFRKRQHVLEIFITKFYGSVMKSKGVHDILGDVEPRRRVGIDVRDYEDQFHPYVVGNVSVTKCDILKSVSEAVTSRITRNPWMKPVATGWVNLLHPFVNNKFESLVDDGISQLLTSQHLGQFIDLVTNAFNQSQQPVPQSATENVNKGSTIISPAKDPREPDSVFNKLSKSFLSWTVEQLFDSVQLLSNFKENRDQVLLFFVDLLDVFVNEVCDENSEPIDDTKQK